MLQVLNQSFCQSRLCLQCCENCFRYSKVPSFIPLVQAKKILATGKSINFLREICQDHTPVKGREELKHTLECTSGELIANFSSNILHSSFFYLLEFLCNTYIDCSGSSVYG